MMIRQALDHAPIATRFAASRPVRLCARRALQPLSIAAALAAVAMGWDGIADPAMLGAGVLFIGATGFAGHAARDDAGDDAVQKCRALCEQWDRDAQRDLFGLPDLRETGGAPLREAAVAIELDRLLEQAGSLPPAPPGIAARAA